MTVALAHDVHGSEGSPVVVLGSSLGTTRTMWDEQLPALAEQFRVVRYDHRGHGGSPVPPGPYSLEDLAGDVLALMDELGVQRAHFAGLSLGGMVAMYVAGTAPERVDRLALLCTSSAMPPDPWWERASAVRCGGLASVAAVIAARWFTEPFSGTDRAAQLRAVLAGVPDEAYASCCEAIAAMDLSPLLATVTASTLVVSGANDPATPPYHGAAIAASIVAGGGHARFAIVPGAAHLANVEKPDVVTQLLLDHMTDQGSWDEDGRG